jgi:hypothetical protein
MVERTEPQKARPRRSPPNVRCHDKRSAAAHPSSGLLLMTVATEIVPAVRELISRYEEEHQAR